MDKTVATMNTSICHINSHAIQEDKQIDDTLVRVDALENEVAQLPWTYIGEMWPNNWIFIHHNPSLTSLSECLAWCTKYHLQQQQYNYCFWHKRRHYCRVCMSAKDFSASGYYKL